MIDAAASVLKAPFPYFGGKSCIVPMIWEHFGDVPKGVLSL